MRLLPGYVLFFLMLVFPAASSMFRVKAVLLAIVLISAIVASFHALHIDRSIALITLSLSSLGLFFCVLGLLLRAPGAVPCIPVYVIWPLVYLLILGGIRTRETIIGLDRVILLSAGTIAFMATAYYLSALGIIPDVPLLGSLFTEDEMGFGAVDGYTRMALPGLNTLSFLAPFVLAVLVTRPSLKGWKRFSLWTILALSYLLILLSGRRAFQIIAALSPVMLWGMSIFQGSQEKKQTRKSLRRVALALVLVIGIAVPSMGFAYDITFPGLAKRFIAAFDFSTTNLDDSPQARREQTQVLLSRWIERPILGAGIGATAHESLRSNEQPWAYELYYLAVLFQTGLVGFLAYFAGIVWIYRQSLKIIKAGGLAAQLMFPVLAGVTGFLIASGTNPYLSKFDGLWVIFLPVAIINHWRLTPEFRVGRAVKRAELS